MKVKPRRSGRPVSTQVEYRRIASLLCGRIRSGQWRAGTILPSFKILAREFHVGERTIRRAMAVLKSEGWSGVNLHRRWVVRANPHAPIFSHGTILEIVSDRLNDMLQLQFVSDIQRGLLVGAGALKSPILIANNPLLRDELPEELLDLKLRGVLLLGTFHRRIFRKLERLNIPAVMIDRPDPHWKLHAVSVDNVLATCDATSRLIALGHRRIAFVRYVVLGMNVLDPDSAEREQGFMLAFQKAGLKKPRNSVFNSFGGPEASVSHWIKGLLSESPPFTAVVVADSARVDPLMKGAIAKGLSIPRDLSIVCVHDGRRLSADFSGIRVNFEEVGRQAAMLLQEPARPAIQLRVPAQWVDGATVAPPRAVHKK